MSAAFRVVADHGVDAATTRRISAEAGMSLASFHYAFESREALLEAVVIDGLSSENSAVHAALQAQDAGTGSATACTLIRTGLIAYLDSVVAEPRREQAILALSHYARRTAGLERLPAELYARYYESAAAALVAAADATGTRWRTPPRELSHLVIATTDGVTLAYLNTGDLGVAHQIVEACVSTLLTHLDET